MRNSFRKTMMGALAVMATHAFAGTLPPNVDKLPPSAGAIPKAVVYLVEVERDGQVRELRLSGRIGSPLSTIYGSPGETPDCTLAGPLGQRYSWRTVGGDRGSVTVLPAKDDNGEVTTVLQVSNYQAVLSEVDAGIGCTAPIGHAASSSAFDVTAMRKGQKRTLSLGDGTTVVVKLFSIDE